MSTAPIISANPGAGRTGTAGLDAMAMPGGLDIAGLLTAFANLSRASGQTEQTTGGTEGTTTSSIPPEILAAILSAAGDFNRGNATQASDAVMQASLQQAAEAFAPVLAGQAGAGGYNSSALGQMANAAMVRAAGEGARTSIQAQTQFGQVQAENLKTAAAVAPKTTTATQQQQQKQVTAPKVDPFTSILTSIATGMASKKLMDLFKTAKEPVSATAKAGQGGLDTTPFDTADFEAGQAATSFTPASTAGVELGSESASTAATAGETFAETAGSSALTESASAAALGVTDATEALFAPVAAQSVEYGTTGFAGEAAYTAAESTAAEAAAASAAEGAGSAFGLGAAAEAGDALIGGFGAAEGAGLIGAGIGADLAFGGAAAGAELGGTALAAAEGFGLADAAPLLLSAVICTELMEQGILSRELWLQGKWYTHEHMGLVREGYHFWARPYIKLMKKYAWATQIAAPFAIGRYQYLAGEWNLPGAITVFIGEPICYFLGVCKKLFVQETPDVQTA